MIIFLFLHFMQSTKLNQQQKNISADATITEGTEKYRGFIIDNILHSPTNDDIHYCVYFPDDYDGSIAYALYVTLPGYNGLYFQGVAANLKTEEFGFEAQKYNEKMIILAPQLSDWSSKSSTQTIELTEYFLSHYKIDKNNVYINGYSGGGETLSLILSDRPDLYTAALICASQWDGNYNKIVDSKTPVYFVIGENDEYYGSQPFKTAYSSIHQKYVEKNVPESEISELLILDVKNSKYYTDKGALNQHGASHLIARDSEIMQWLFNHRKSGNTNEEDWQKISRIIPDNVELIPNNYYSAASNQGRLERLTYLTYESISYSSKSKILNKTCYVYLPYGYTEEKRYNIFYLMHGGWSNERTYLGTPESPNGFKNVIDHAIQDGKMREMIIVCPTYNNESPEDSGNYGLAQTLTNNYHNELLNDLMPAVEGKYRTYSKGTSPSDFKDSRNHRGFAGFSMGSVCTWRTFQYCLEYFRYFITSSGGITSSGSFMDSIVTGFGLCPGDFFIRAFSGTNDFAYSGFTSQINAMLNSPGKNFIQATSELDGNLAYRVLNGASHDGGSANIYMYNGFIWFWNYE